MRDQPTSDSCRLRSRAERTIAVLAALVLLLLTGCPADPSSSDVLGAHSLLAGKRPSRSEGMRNVGAINDGIVTPRGDSWNSDLTAVFRHESSFIEYDLGEVAHIRAIYLQGDNNDTYTIATSDDGSTYRIVWNAGPTPGVGLQERTIRELDANGRYIRISAAGGDRAYAISEVQLFSDVPATLPNSASTRTGLDVHESLRSQVLLLAFAALVLIATTYRNAPSWLRVGGSTLAVCFAFLLYRALDDAWPPDARDVSFVRATVAAIAALLVASDALMTRRFRPNRRATLAGLWLCALGACACFFNLGYPQYRDHRTDTPSFVHNFDMRVYYPVAKYFEELGFDGLYLGSIAAYIDDANVTSQSLSNVQLRDLRTHRITTVAEVTDELRAVRSRFSPARWESFRVDMRYFRQSMGVDDYLRSMTDHGGNATPFWLCIAKLVFGLTTASNETLLWAALLDPILLLTMFAMIARTFSVRAMLVCAVVFGANDYYMFGTNWAGATLRHDWLAYLGMGVCLLRKERWRLAGVLLAMTAMIRAFPALACVGATLPFGYAAWQRRKDTGRFPQISELTWRHPVVQFGMGVVGFAFAAWLTSSLLLSFDAWAQWMHKVSLLDRDAHLNHISLRGLIAGSGSIQHRLLQARMPVFVGSVVGSIVAVIAAARGKGSAQGALLGCLLIPVFFNPANYYLHYVCLLPLIVVDADQLLGGESSTFGTAPEYCVGWTILLGMCVAQYWTVLTVDSELHFQTATAIFFTATSALLINVIRAEGRRRFQFATSGGRDQQVDNGQRALPLAPPPR